MYKYSGYTRNQQDRILLFERQRSAKRKLEEQEKKEKEEAERNKETSKDPEDVEEESVSYCYDGYSHRYPRYNKFH